LAKRFRSLDKRAVRIDHGVARVLPAHVLVTDRRPRLVLLETVAVAVAIGVDPRETSLCGLQVLLKQPSVAGCAPCVVQRDEVEWRRVGSSVVRGVRYQLEVRQLAVANLVEDLAGLRVAIVIALLGLQRAQYLEGSAGELRID